MTLELLNQRDGFSLDDVIKVVAATNCPDILTLCGAAGRKEMRSMIPIKASWWECQCCDVNPFGLSTKTCRGDRNS